MDRSNVVNNVMIYKGYSVWVDYDVEDEIFFGWIVGIIDGVGFYGESVRELKFVFYEVVDDYLEICCKIGKVLEKFYFGKMMFCVDFEIYCCVVIVVEFFGKSFNQWVEDVLVKVVGVQ